jgi:hypothetical protein
MPKLDEFQEQQELNLFFKQTVPPAASPEAKKLVAEAPYHPGYEGAAISTITIPPLTTEDISTITSMTINPDNLTGINLGGWGGQLSVITNTDATPFATGGGGGSYNNTSTIPSVKLGSALPSVKLGSALKFDTDKLPVNLLSSEALMQTAAVLKFGADKYAEHNWRAGFAWSRPLAAAMRHIMAFNDGEDKDPESGLSHLAHAMCCIMFLLEFEKTHRELDDRYKVDVPATKNTSK